MKKFILFVLIIAAAGCASDATRHFTVEVEPADAEIAVFSGKEGTRRIYRSPADITAVIPSDFSQRGPIRMEISRKHYKTKTLDLAGIVQERITVKLDKIVRYRLSYRMVSPVVTEAMAFRDKIIAVRVQPEEYNIKIAVQNLSSRPLRIPWDLADYTDQNHRSHRVMPVGTDPQNRNNAIPPQIVGPGASVEQTIILKDALVYKAETRTYDTKPLFPLDSDAALTLKGKSILLFLPIEQGGAIIPSYNIKLQIVDVIKEL